MSSRFAAFTQRELEILCLGLDVLDSNIHFLPQHRAKMYAMTNALRDELSPCQRATENSSDGSHFGDVYVDEQPAKPEPYKLGGVPLFEIAADIARTQARMITQEDRADGRVISPRPVRSNIHD